MIVTKSAVALAPVALAQDAPGRNRNARPDAVTVGVGAGVAAP